jgi:hypothetical protein
MGQTDVIREHARGTQAFARGFVVAACAASAGAHAGLVPEHLREAPQLGVAFIVSVALLLAVAAAIVIYPANRRLVQAAALLLGGLIVAYAASRTTGLPWLEPHPESADAVGLATKAVEALGFLFCLMLSKPGGSRTPPMTQEVHP